MRTERKYVVHRRTSSFTRSLRCAILAKNLRVRITSQSRKTGASNWSSEAVNRRRRPKNRLFRTFGHHLSELKNSNYRGPTMWLLQSKSLRRRLHPLQYEAHQDYQYIGTSEPQKPGVSALIFLRMLSEIGEKGSSKVRSTTQRP